MSDVSQPEDSRVKQIQWTGIDLSSAEFPTMRSLFADTFGLPALVDSPEFAVFAAPNYSMVELYGPAAPKTPWRRLGVAVGFDCVDLDAMVLRLASAGIVLIQQFDGMDDFAKLGIKAENGILTTPNAGKGGGDYRFGFFNGPDHRVYAISQSVPS